MTSKWERLMEESLVEMDETNDIISCNESILTSVDNYIDTIVEEYIAQNIPKSSIFDTGDSVGSIFNLLDDVSHKLKDIIDEPFSMELSDDTCDIKEEVELSNDDYLDDPTCGLDFSSIPEYNNEEQYSSLDYGTVEYDSVFGA